MFKLLKDLLIFIFTLVEVLLTVRFVLKLLGANPTAPFVTWIYDSTQPLSQPFLLVFPTPSVRGGYVLEFTTLFALFAYAFVGYLIEQLLEILVQKTK